MVDAAPPLPQGGHVAALRADLASARKVLAEADNLSELMRVATAAASIARHCVDLTTGKQVLECNRRGNHQQNTQRAHNGSAPHPPKPSAAAAAATDEDADAAAAAAAAGADAVAQGRAYQLFGLPPGWGGARLAAHVERTGVKPQSAIKAEGRSSGVVVFATALDASHFVAALPAITQQRGAPLTRAVRVPPANLAAKRGVKRAAEEARRQAKAARTDVRDAVCPWWDVPYEEQLEAKAAALREALGRVTTVLLRHFSLQKQPPWMKAALSHSGHTAAPLDTIIRSPQLDGYRNKSEFTIGPDVAGRPSVGFLMGSFADGVTTVEQPGSCRHISRVALGYAEVMQEYLRGPDQAHFLPVWNKTSSSGFWRLLLVREGRHATYLPLPTQAAAPPAGAGGAAGEGAKGTGAAGGAMDVDGSGDAERGSGGVGGAAASGSGAGAASGGGAGAGVVEAGTPLSHLPLGRWKVAVPGNYEASPDCGIPLSQVSEAEPVAPLPDEVLVMVQLNPAATTESAFAAERAALAKYIRDAAAARGLPLTCLLMQSHSGVSNAAAATAPIEPLDPAEAAAAAADDGAATAADNAVPTSRMHISDTLCSMKFRVSANSFFQVNSSCACLLYRVASDWAAAPSVAPPAPSAARAATLLLDVCCGTGTIGLMLAAAVDKVVGIDSAPSAIVDARANAALNGITNAEFVAGPAEATIGDVLAQHADAYDDVVAVVDPPRNGLHRAVLAALLGCAKLRRIVYVSCNPDSLADNLMRLCGPALHETGDDGGRDGKRGAQANPGGYTPFSPVKAMAVDLFPHTAHVEAVVLLER